MSFTTKEYIFNNNLQVEESDTKAYRMVAEHLRRMGYEMRRRMRSGVEVRVWEPVDVREQYLSSLENRLMEIERHAGVRTVREIDSDSEV